MSELELLNKEEELTNNSTPGFNSVGQILCYYRKLKGIELEDIARNTMVSVKYLSQLEKDIYDSMPSPVFVYSYIKHFAKEVGLDGNELVKLYQRQFGIHDDPSNEINSSKIISDETDLGMMYLEKKDNIELNNNNGNNEQSDSLDFDRLYNEMSSANNDSVNAADSYQESNNMQVDNMYNNSLEEQETEPVVTQEIIDATSQAERIITNARREADRMLREAKQESNQLRIEAKEYADSILKHLEAELTQALSQVKNGKEFIKSQKK